MTQKRAAIIRATMPIERTTNRKKGHGGPQRTEGGIAGVSRAKSGRLGSLSWVPDPRVAVPGMQKIAMT